MCGERSAMRELLRGRSTWGNTMDKSLTSCRAILEGATGVGILDFLSGGGGSGSRGLSSGVHRKA